MRRLLLLVPLAACGSSAPKVATHEAAPVDAAVTAATAVVVLGHAGAWLPIACPGEVDGVGGGAACRAGGTPQSSLECRDAAGIVMGVTFEDAAEELALRGAEPLHTQRTDPRDKVTHAVDLDGDGDPESIVLVPHDNRASYGRSLAITDGHDPLMTDELDPFPDAADVQLLGTSDVDGDGRRELILYAPDDGGFSIAVQEHWSAAEAYRLTCRDP